MPLFAHLDFFTYLLEITLEVGALLGICLLLDAFLEERDALWRNLLWKTAVVAITVLPLAKAFLPDAMLSVDFALALDAPWTAPTALLQSLWTEAAYLIGLALVLGHLVANWAAVARLRQSSRPARPIYQSRFAALAARMDIGRPAELRLHHRLSGPSQVGIRRPQVLLPLHGNHWLAPKIFEAAAAHELVHAQRRDYLFHLLGGLALALHWFNPLAWLAVRRLRQSGEWVCDDRASAALGDRTAYIEALLAAAHNQRRPLVGSVVAMAHTPLIVHRIERLLRLAAQPALRPVPPTARRGFVAVLAGLFLAMAACDFRFEDPATDSPLAQAPTEELFTMLHSRDPDVRRRGAYRLLALGPSVVPRLIETSRAPQTRTRFLAVQLLGQLDDRRALVPLVERLEDPSANVAQKAARALGQLALPDAVPALLAYTDDPSPLVRRQVALALGACHAADASLDPAVVEALAAAMADPVPQVRIGAIEGLRQLDYAAAGAGLVALAFDPEASVRHVAVQALGELAGTERLDWALKQQLIEALVSALDETAYQSIRTKAVRAIAAAGDRAALTALKALAQRGTPEDRREVKRALAQFARS